MNAHRRPRAWGLTAVAFVLAGLLAVGGTVLATAPAGVVSSSASSSSPAPGVDDDWTQTTRTLLTFVPRDLREQCQVREPAKESGIDDDVVDAERGALICSVSDGAIGVRFVQFDTNDHADTYLDQLSDPEPTDDPSEEPGDCPTQFRIQRGNDDTDVGRYVCFLASDTEGLADGTPVISWTYTPRAIVAQAYDSDLDLARLRKFWATAGPLEQADKRGIPPLATAASLRSAGKALLAATPDASRPKCKVIDSLTPAALGNLFAWRLWLVADIEECRPEHGSTDTEYVKFASAGAMDDYYDAIAPLPEDVADARVTVDGVSCAGASSYRRDGKRAGRYACHFSDKDTDAKQSSTETAHFIFSDTHNRVVGSGGAPANRAKALIEWWQDDAQLG